MQLNGLAARDAGAALELWAKELVPGPSVIALHQDRTWAAATAAA